MTVNGDTFVRDTLYFFKNDLSSNITDPIQSSRASDSRFIMTSYPKRKAQYPLITLKLPSVNANRAGMQTDAVDMEITLEVRIWARNVKERDTLFTDIFNRLRNIQFITSTGSVDNRIHNFQLNSAVEVDEEGEGGIMSKVCEFTYNIYNFT